MKKLLLTLLLLVAPALSVAQLRISSPSAFVIDRDGNVLFEKNADVARPIASISKLFVGAVMIDKLPSFYSDVTIDGSERALMFGLLPKHDRKVKRGSSYTPFDLLNISLVSSNNLTTSALAIQIGLDDVIYQTNQLTHDLGLSSVSITEPTGLSRANVASARDVALFALHVMDTDLARISVQPQYVANGTTFNTTNVFTRLDGWNVHVQKTGFTNAAGRCVVMVLEMGGRTFSLAILGASSQQALLRDVVAIRKFLGDTGFQEPITAPRKSKKINSRPVVTPNSLMKG